ncbi:hypothetical protein [Spiroplasma sp. SV19]|uniref:hypothetical protein n=1 Tax=Spiroplasma sp. SV19 TaxID=2570468 RepID=UPI0024B7100B|nr:hypothetical protein [Spiroplasma sp. SV19]WHQ36404.1 hypothetical protein E7Y35_00385 [Spiroplasma sp. SV19]
MNWMITLMLKTTRILLKGLLKRLILIQILYKKQKIKNVINFIKIKKIIFRINENFKLLSISDAENTEFIISRIKYLTYYADHNFETYDPRIVNELLVKTLYEYKMMGGTI